MLKFIIRGCSRYHQLPAYGAVLDLFAKPTEKGEFSPSTVGTSRNTGVIVDTQLVVAILAAITIMGAIIGWLWARSARRRFVEHHR